MKMYENEVRIKHGEIICSSSELDLGVTLKGGQSFRWFCHNNGYRGIFDGCVWTLTQNDTHLSYIVQGPLIDSKNYDGILSEYFRLNECLTDLCKRWTTIDQHFKKSLNKINGVRILNQNVVENVFSFICSSNNNIQRISKMVEKLCTLFGEKICSIEGKNYYNFPSIEALANKNVENILKMEKFGYRAKYIANAAKCLIELGGKEWLLNLHKKNNVSYIQARKQLITLPGIGPKVADCICLMSLGHLESIPVDTHIFQIGELWGPLAGWAQALVFCAKINDIVTTTTSNYKYKNSTNNKSFHHSNLKNFKK